MKDHPSQWIASGLTCRNVADRTTDYLEDRLPFSVKIRVGLHLASCGGCRTYVKQMASVSEALACLPKPHPQSIDHLRQRFSAVHGCLS